VPDDGSGSPAPVAAQRLAAMDDSGTDLGVGESASSANMKLLANIPKNGAFAEEGAYQTDLAFKGDYAFAGNYNGFTVYNIKKGNRPQQVAQVVCPGSQNDISVSGNLLVLSTDSSRSNASCENVSQPASVKESMSSV
jgi:hypothetical protein